jgi:TonB family protein
MRYNFPLLVVFTLIAGCVTPPATYDVNGKMVVGAEEAARVIATRANTNIAAQTAYADRSPMLTYTVAPVMPREAVTRKIEGDVMAELSVGRDGNVTTVNILKSPHLLLSDAVTDAMKKWVFRPMIVDGMPQAFLVKQTYAFRLPSSDRESPTVVAKNAAIKISESNTFVVLAKDAKRGEGPSGIADKFDLEGKIVAYTTFRWDETNTRGGQQTVTAKWFSGDKLVSTPKNTYDFGTPPYYVWFQINGTALGVGKARVEVYVDGTFVGSKYFEVVEKL